MEGGHTTPKELAEALEDCCLLQSPETVSAAEREQGSQGGTP
ncbi:hypothetical protein [Streptomyces sp. NPDC058612]